MKRTVSFITPTELSYIDLVSMGGSEKQGDTSKIGQFCSGLKYAMALMLRNDIEFRVDVVGNNTAFSVYRYSIEDELTGKSKELIGILQEGGGVEIRHKTGFSVDLGYNWEPWMILRELYSNMVDEGGYYTEDEEEILEGTKITLSFNKGSVFEDIWDNRHLYINESEDLFKVSGTVKALKNPNNKEYIRIYKQNILVYEDKEVYSEYSYIISYGQIDERRILSDYYNIRGRIIDAIFNCENEDFLRGLFKESFVEDEKAFLSGGSCYSTASKTIYKLIKENIDKFDSENTYECFVDSVKKRKDCSLPGKKIMTVEDSLWGYSTTVEIVDSPKEHDNRITTLISKAYNLDLKDIDVKESSLKRAKVVADKYNKCLIISPDFSLEEDMPEFVVEYYTLKCAGNIVKCLSEELAKKLKK